MPPLTQQRGIYSSQVIARRAPCREHFEITLAAENFPDAHPGQFVQILCRSNDATSIAENVPMLRRPFSIAGLRERSDAREIDIMGHVVGAGTAWLDALEVADRVDILGPLGRGFTKPPSGGRALLIAGGVGLPPIRWFGEILNKNGHLCDVIYAQSRDLVPLTLREEPMKDGSMTSCVEEFAREGIACAITTDDGTCGLPGRVTDAIIRYLDRRKNEGALQVYACGPESMLKAIARLCFDARIPCELAMERVMGCGMGTCQSCVIPVKDASREDGWRYALCCTEGPVMDGQAVIWPET